VWQNVTLEWECTASEDEGQDLIQLEDKSLLIWMITDNKLQQVSTIIILHQATYQLLSDPH
jgi:hypothetical protein